MWVYFGCDLTVTKCRARILAVTTNDPHSPANWRKEGDILWGVVHPDGSEPWEPEDKYPRLNWYELPDGKYP